MGQLFWVGLLCWAISGAIGIVFAYISRNGLTKAGVVWKGLASLAITMYAVVLAYLSLPMSSATQLFIAGLGFSTLGDILMGYLQYKKEGDVRSLANMVVDKELNGWTVGVAVTGVLFIISFFLQMVAFLKALGSIADPADYVIPFLVFFLLPPTLAATGAVLARLRALDVASAMFIIGLFYVLILSGLFASAYVYSFALLSIDMKHAIFIQAGAIIYLLSVLFVLVRYENPEKFDTKDARIWSRVLTYLGRMILAGCAFMF